MNSQNKRGFTLVELLIVIAIIGIVSAIAIPNLLMALHKARQKGTVSDLKTVGAAVESYLTDWTFVPQIPAGPITALDQDFFRPFNIKVLVTKDHWGNTLLWDQPGNFHDDYSITSYGRDHAASGPFGAPHFGSFYPCSTMSSFDNDIVFSQGVFAFGPWLKN